MHPSRMRTVCCSSRLRGGVCLGGVFPGGVSQHALRQTHACENITFPQLRLRTVTTHCRRAWQTDLQTHPLPSVWRSEDPVAVGDICPHLLALAWPSISMQNEASGACTESFKSCKRCQDNSAGWALDSWTSDHKVKSHWRQHFFAAAETFDANIVKNMWKTQMATEKVPKR